MSVDRAVHLNEVSAAARNKIAYAHNPCDYYCVTSVLRSFKGYFYSSKFAYLSKHLKATNYSILELVAYILRKMATSCKS